MDSAVLGKTTSSLLTPLNGTKPIKVMRFRESLKETILQNVWVVAWKQKDCLFFLAVRVHCCHSGKLEHSAAHIGHGHRGFLGRV